MSAPAQHEDWLDFVRALLAADVRFLVVGAHALAVHGVPRGTQDLDVWAEPTEENARRVWRALDEFGAPAEALGIRLEDLTSPDVVAQFGLPPKRIDLMTGVSGVAAFEDAWTARVVRPLGPVPNVPFIGREHLLANKRASGRRKDLGDVDALNAPPIG